MLDEWHHKDFTVGRQKVVSADHIIATFELNQQIGDLHGMTLVDFTTTIQAQGARMGNFERE